MITRRAGRHLPYGLALGAALGAWFEYAHRLPHLNNWPNVAIVALGLMPSFFAVTWLALPLRGDLRRLGLFAVSAIGAALLFAALDAPILENFAKFLALTALGWLFLSAFEALSWVVLVALIIPFVDAYSVWRGPTHVITLNHPAVFTTLSIAIALPGGGAARLGLPDVMFFSLFLAASVRFGLRPGATWLAMMAGLGVTWMLTTVWVTSGLPALPAISLGFLVANGDLIWRSLAASRQRAREAEGS